MNRRIEPEPRELKKLMATFEAIMHFFKTLNGDGLVIGSGVLKGGTGKSTSALYIALWWAWIAGLRVVVVDTDAKSQSLTTWYHKMKALGAPVPFDFVEHDVAKAGQRIGDIRYPRLRERLSKLRKEYDVVVVDLGGGDNETFAEACENAHIMLMPVAPSGWEHERLDATRYLCERHARLNPWGLVYTAMLVRCDFSTSLADEARYVLENPPEPEDEHDEEQAPMPLPHPYFDISKAPHHVRSWDWPPKRSELEEWGLLIKHIMKDVIEMAEAA